MDLQDTFYVLAIVYMSLMLLITIALAIAVFIIKKKINDIHQKIDAKLAVVNNIAHLGSDIIGAAKKVAGRR
jgi:hypothetical protein